VIGRSFKCLLRTFRNSRYEVLEQKVLDKRPFKFYSLIMTNSGGPKVERLRREDKAASQTSKEDAG